MTQAMAGLYALSEGIDNGAVTCVSTVSGCAWAVAQYATSTVFHQRVATHNDISSVVQMWFASLCRSMRGSCALPPQELLCALTCATKAGLIPAQSSTSAEATAVALNAARNGSGATALPGWTHFVNRILRVWQPADAC